MKRRFISNFIQETEFPDTCWKKDCSFLVLMNRWGDTENHTYPLGVYKTLDTAVFNSNKEVQKRGGKYSAQIWVNKHKVGDTHRRLTLIYSINGRILTKSKNNE